jgi:lipopolysaccharide biosynthesis glycosyltransferase
MDDAIDIAICFDVRYAPHAAAVIASVVRNAPSARLRFIVLYSGVDQAVRSRIETIAPNALFLWTEVNDSNWPAFAERVNRATLFRFALETLAPADCRRVIYLDTDVIVMRDVSELWRFDLGLSPVGAVIDYYATVAGADGKLLNSDIDPVVFAARWKLSPPSSYFNAGYV